MSKRPDMKLTRAIKRGIRDDWLTCFPEFSALSDVRDIGRRVGPFIQGIHLDLRANRDDYSSQLFLHNCAEGLGFKTLSFSGGSESFRTISIRWSLEPHERDFRKRAQFLREASRLPMEGPVSTSQIIKAFESYIVDQYGSSAYPESTSFIYFLVYEGLYDKARAYLDHYDAFWTDKSGEKDAELIAWRQELETVIEAGSEALREVTEKEFELLKADHLREAPILKSV